MNSQCDVFKNTTEVCTSERGNFRGTDNNSIAKIEHIFDLLFVYHPFMTKRLVKIYFLFSLSFSPT